MNNLTPAREFQRPRIVKTKDLRIPNEYTLALDNECRDFAFNEERAPLNRGLWRSNVFGVNEETPLDVEIGTGQGLHFRSHCEKHPERCLVGFELKYKPLIQTVRGLSRVGRVNGRGCRVHAFNIDQVFAEGEVNNMFMHFPDPWVSPRKPKNRMINERMVEIFWNLQRPGSTYELKTDSQEYFEWACRHMKARPYEELIYSENWHQDERSEGHVRTQFENIFSRKQMPIYYCLWSRP